MAKTKGGGTLDIADALRLLRPPHLVPFRRQRRHPFGEEMTRPASESPPIPSSSRLKDASHVGQDKGRPSLAVIRDPSRRIRQAVRDNNVTLLDRLQHKYDLRNADRSRMTSLSWAAVEGNLEVFEWLLMDYGHDDQELSRDHENNSILHILASLPSPTALFSRNPLLQPCPDHRPKQDVYETALKMASLYIYCFPFLANWCNAAGKTPLHIAAQLGHAPMVQFLLENEADVDLVDAQGNTALHYASAYGHVDTLKLLLEAGCASHTRNAEGFTASEFAFTERVYVELESTAKAVSRARPPRPVQTQRQGSGLPIPMSGPSRARSGSASTSGSGLAPPHQRGLGIASGSPNLLDKAQYFDASDTFPLPPRTTSRRSNTPPPMSRRSSEGVPEWSSSSSHVPPPVPPLPPFTQQPSRSPSLPAQLAVRQPMIFPPEPQGSQGG